MKGKTEVHDRVVGASDISTSEAGDSAAQLAEEGLMEEAATISAANSLICPVCLARLVRGRDGSRIAVGGGGCGSAMQTVDEKLVELVGVLLLVSRQLPGQHSSMLVVLGLSTSGDAIHDAYSKFIDTIASDFSSLLKSANVSVNAQLMQFSSTHSYGLCPLPKKYVVSSVSCSSVCRITFI